MKNIKYILALVLFMFIGVNTVYAKNSAVELTGDSILTKAATGTDASGQSMAISDDSLHAYVFKADASSPVADAVNVDIFTRNSINDEFTFTNRISGLTYSIDNQTKYVEHGNGSTYYQDGNNEYILVTTKINGTTSNYLLKYLITNDHSGLTYIGKYEFPFAPEGVTYDKDNKIFYVAGGREIWKYDANLQNGVVLRKKGVGSASPGGTVGFYYENQDVTYHDKHLYSEAIVNANNVERIKTGTGLDVNVGDTLIMVIHAETGDFVKYLVFNYDSVANYIKNKGYFTQYTVKEIEDIVFINNEPYFLFQKAGNVLLIKSKTFDGGVDIYDYTKLYIRYHMNGGTLQTTSSNVTSDGDNIVIFNRTNILAGELGGYIGNAGFYNYNNEASVNIVKEGFTVETGKEWIDADGNVFDQRVKYKISDIVDITNEDKVLDLYVNWVPGEISSAVPFDFDGLTGSTVISASASGLVDDSDDGSYEYDNDGIDVSNNTDNPSNNPPTTTPVSDVDTSQTSSEDVKNPNTGTFLSIGAIILLVIAVGAFIGTKKLKKLYAIN